MNRTIALLLILIPLCGFSQKKPMVKVKKAQPYYVGGYAGLASGEGTYREAGYLDGIYVNVEVGRFFHPRFAVIAKVGLYYLEVDRDLYSLNFRDMYHLSSDYKPSAYFGKGESNWPMYVRIGPWLSTPVHPKLAIDLKILAGVQAYNYTPSGGLSRQINGIEEKYYIGRVDVNPDFVIDIGVDVKLKIHKRVKLSLNTDFIYTNQHIREYVHFSKNDVFVNKTYFNYTQQVLVFNIGVGAVYIIDRRQW